MNEIFREVDEDYRQEQFLRFWHQNAKLIILVLILAIAGAVAGGFWQNHQIIAQGDETYKLSKAEEDATSQKPNDAKAALIAIINQMSGPRITPARFIAARAAITAGDIPSAIKLYDQISASGKATSVESQLADIQSIILQIQTGDPATLSQRLDKLVDKNNAWQYSARELQVLLAMRQNDMKKAHEIALALSRDHGAPDGVHTRASQLAELTGEGLPPDALTPSTGTSDMPTVQLPETQ